MNKEVSPRKALAARLSTGTIDTLRDRYSVDRYSVDCKSPKSPRSPTSFSNNGVSNAGFLFVKSPHSNGKSPHSNGMKKSASATRSLDSATMRSSNEKSLQDQVDQLIAEMSKLQLRHDTLAYTVLQLKTRLDHVEMNSCAHCGHCCKMTSPREFEELTQGVVKVGEKVNHMKLLINYKLRVFIVMWSI